MEKHFDKENAVAEGGKVSDEFPEIQEALDAMGRISVIETVKARDIFECAPSYFPLR